MSSHIITITLSLIFFNLYSKFQINYTIIKVLEIYKKLFKIIRKKNITDINKEKFLKLYSISLFCKSLKILTGILIIVISIYFASFFDNLFISHILSFFGIFESTITIVFYYLLKKYFL